MERQQAIYVADLLEMILRAESGTVFGQARDKFMLAHGTFGLKQLFLAEQQLREEHEIPDSSGNVYIAE